MQTISACIIGKDEEEMLPRCLKSIVHIVDEIIFVDTGSTDRTVEIAREYGAKVAHHPWEHDFSLHRNQSIDYATGDWILIIDCDEKVVNGEDLRRQIGHVKGDDIIGLQILLKDIDSSGNIRMLKNQVRLFRRGTCKYYRSIHNKLLPIDPEKQFSGFPDSKAYIDHYGYSLGVEKDAQKIERVRAMLESAMEKDPDDPDNYFYLAQIYGELNDFQKTLELCREYWKRKPKDFNETIFITYLMSLNEIIDAYPKDADQKGYGKLVDEWTTLFHQARHRIPDDLDILKISMNYYANQGNVRMLLDAASRFVMVYDAIEKDRRAIGGKFVFSYQQENLLEALFHLSCECLILGFKHLNRFNRESGGELKEGMMATIKSRLQGLGIEFHELEGEND